jgi:hypothetical protein
LIRVERSSEPPALARARARRLEKAARAYDEHGAPSPALAEELDGYDAGDVKKLLYADQRKKCAWCECRRDFSSSPVEHFRPKDGAWRTLPEEPKVSSTGHYWWLTWTWENLLFSCPRCNDRGHKANYFPLVPGSSEALAPPRPLPAPLPSPLVDVTAEQPLLLDPAVDVFLDHVQWMPSNHHMARRLWIWTPTALTERGRATIKILKLTELADEVQQHLVDHVLPKIEEVEQHLRGKRTKQAAASWQSVLALLEPDRSLTAATWCALSHWTDAAELAAAKLPAPPRPR